MLDRLMRFVSPEPNSGCWLWLGPIKKTGYARYQHWQGGKRHTVSAARLIYEQVKGPILPGLEPDHICRVRCCVNPDHLEAVTHIENVRRSVPFRRQQPTCRRGHARSVENTYVNGRNRVCRVCNRIMWARNHGKILEPANG